MVFIPDAGREVGHGICGGGERVGPGRVGGRRIAACRNGDAGSGPGDDLFKRSRASGGVWFWFVFAGRTFAQRRSVSRWKMKSSSEDIVFFLEFSHTLL